MRQINSRITIERVPMPSPPEDSQPAPTGAAPSAPRERRRPCALQTRLERTPGAQKSLGFHGFPGLRTVERADAGLALLKRGLAVLLKSKHINKRGVRGLSSLHLRLARYRLPLGPITHFQICVPGAIFALFNEIFIFEI